MFGVKMKAGDTVAVLI